MPIKKKHVLSKKSPKQKNLSDKKKQLKIHTKAQKQKQKPNLKRFFFKKKIGKLYKSYKN